MAESLLLSKSKAFALDIIKVAREVRQKHKEYEFASQFFRSGTSIGANIREAFSGQSTADFIAKLQIALKECSETEYWLELLLESGYYSDPALLNKCVEIKKMLISSLKTAKARAENPPSQVRGKK